MLYISLSDCIRKKDVLQKIRDYTFQEFDHKCAYCDRDADGLDHIIPRHSSGSDDFANTVPACTPCNRSKGTRRYEDWYTEASHPDWTEYRSERIAEWRSR